MTPKKADLRFEILRVEHLPELATVLLHPEVYAHIDRSIPSIDQFTLSLERAIAGPVAETNDERWLNYLVRESSGDMVGRLEATIHHGIAEVAFLLGRRFWGRNFGFTGLNWLHDEVFRSHAISDFWATTTRDHLRSQRLLARCGYDQAELPATPLFSYNSGDIVFRKHFEPNKMLERSGDWCAF
jgi:RimJ/RimL family protein N-acetyltransferase